MLVTEVFPSQRDPWCLIFINSGGWKERTSFPNALSSGRTEPESCVKPFVWFQGYHLHFQFVLVQHNATTDWLNQTRQHKTRQDETKPRNFLPTVRKTGSLWPGWQFGQALVGTPSGLQRESFSFPSSLGTEQAHYSFCYIFIWALLAHDIITF